MPSAVPEIIDAPNVQGVILWGYGGMPNATFSMRRIVEPRAFRHWLASRLDRIVHADHRSSPTGVALNVAFTAAGLDVIRPEVEALEGTSLRTLGLSRRFREGMAARARRLGDVNDCAPSFWEWHDRPEARADDDSKTVHVLLMCYWSDDTGPGTTPPSWALGPADSSTGLEDGGMVEVGRLGTAIRRTEHGRMKEPFGFTDGVGDPRIRSWVRGTKTPPVEGNVVEPGEFLLGYPDQDESTLFEPDFKSVRAPVELRSPLHAAHDETRPVHRFLQDGSYLVARKLEQDVPGFLRFVWTRAGDPDANPSAHARAVLTLASKMVGRWPNGVSMAVARTPEQMDTQASSSLATLDEFSYARDAAGVGCPFGAHVRRVHPRDTVFDHSPATANERRNLVNRRRLIRRGRTYGPDPFPNRSLTRFLFPRGRWDEPITPDAFEHAVSQMEAHERGLLFLCFNADIAGQFEHVQRTWINDPHFRGLDRDPDPIAGPGGDTGIENPSVTIFSSTKPTVVEGLTRYVHTRAGGYFFMPGIETLQVLAGG